MSSRVSRLTTSDSTDDSEISTPVAPVASSIGQRLVDAAEHADAAALADVVRADEPDHPIAEVGRALGGVEQADGVGVGADDEDRPADLPVAPQPDEDPPGDGRARRPSAAARRPGPTSIQSRDSALNWRANDSATMTPTLSSEALMIRRNSSVGRSTARDWYSLFSEKATIQTGNVTKASTRCTRWTPSSCAGAHDRLPREGQDDAQPDDRRRRPGSAAGGASRARPTRPISTGSGDRRSVSAAARPPVMLPAEFNSARPRIEANPVTLQPATEIVPVHADVTQAARERHVRRRARAPRDLDKVQRSVAGGQVAFDPRYVWDNGRAVLNARWYAAPRRPRRHARPAARPAGRDQPRTHGHRRAGPARLDDRHPGARHRRRRVCSRSASARSSTSAARSSPPSSCGSAPTATSGRTR